MSKKTTSGKAKPPKISKLVGTQPVRHTYSVSQIIKTKNALAEVLTFEFEGKIINGSNFDRLLAVVRDGLSGEANGQALYDSLRHLINQPMTAQVIEETSHRLAGNMPRLRRRRAVSAWHVQRIYEWVPVQIMAARKQRNNRGELGSLLSFKFLAGTPCPLTVLQWWSLRKCRFIARYLGYSKPPPRNAKYPAKYPFTTPEQLVTLRFLALVDPIRSEKEPVFTSLEYPGSLQAWNRKQIRKRFREDYLCPEGQPRSFPCHLCIRGYSTCAAGTHRLDYVVKPCSTCGNEQAVWDKELSTKCCVNCYNTAVIEFGSKSK